MKFLLKLVGSTHCYFFLRSMLLYSCSISEVSLLAAAAAAAVCSVPVVARDWRQEIGAISPSTAGPRSPSGG